MSVKGARTPGRRVRLRKAVGKQANIIDTRLKQIVSRVVFSSLIRSRHSARPKFSYEFDLLSHIIRSAGDIFRVELKRISPRFSPLELKRIKFVTVNFNRNDIESLHSQSYDKEVRQFCWDHDRPGLCYTKINWTADPLYKRHEWMELRKQAISDALNIGGDVVVLGEFDYPPQEKRVPRDQASFDNDMQRFEDDIEAIINDAGRDIILLAGSRHEERADQENAVTNTAYLFLNDSARIEPKTHKIPIFKRSPAKKIGESLSSIPGISLDIFQTFIGNIAVLICSDAYDPSIICEMILNSGATDRQRVQFFIVPAYNPSDKLVQSCQALSYFTNSCVIYCNSHLSGGEFGLSEFFLCGERLTDFRAYPFIKAKFSQSTLPKIIKRRRSEYDLYVYDVRYDFILEVVDHSKLRLSEQVKSLQKTQY